MTGEFAALATALCWAVAARLFKQLGGDFSPLLLNFYKGLLAIFGFTLILSVQAGDWQLSAQALSWLLISGVIGIGIGDTLFFLALKRMSDSQTMLITETSAPIFTALFAMFWLSEWLTWQQWLGGAGVIVAVRQIISAQAVKPDVKGLHSKSSGIADASKAWLLAAGAAVCQALGAVVSRDVLVQNEIGVATAALMRLLGGVVFVALLLLWRGSTWRPKNTTNNFRLWIALVVASVIGTLLALYLQMLAFAHTSAAIVQTLFTSSVLLSLGIAWCLGERVPKNIVLWSLLALFSVSMLVVM